MEAAFKILTSGATSPLSAATRCVENAKTPIRSDVFAAAWHELLRRYLVRTPTASRAIAHLDGLGARVHNDHIALRSFVDSGGHSGLAYLDQVFTAFGYAAQDDIVIPSLPVNARWYEPPVPSQLFWAAATARTVAHLIQPSPRDSDRAATLSAPWEGIGSSSR